MNIRPFTEADRPFLRTLFLASRKANWTWLDDAEWQLEDFDRVTLGERVLVAEEDGHRVGFAAVLDNDNFLHSLFIDPAGRAAARAARCCRRYRTALPLPGRSSVWRKTYRRRASIKSTAGG